MFVFLGVTLTRVKEDNPNRASLTTVVYEGTPGQRLRPVSRLVVVEDEYPWSTILFIILSFCLPRKKRRVQTPRMSRVGGL